MLLPADEFAGKIASLQATIPPACVPGGRGWCAAVAGLLEAATPKPGNVHPGASFADLSFADLAAAAVAVAPALERAASRPLGETILAAVEASRGVTASNVNLGIVLLLAPLAAVPDRAAARATLEPAAIERVLAATGSADAAAVWRAISRAAPGGLGSSERWDVAGPSPSDIRAAMRHAAHRDSIARQWAVAYEELFAGPVADIAAAVDAGLSLQEAILRGHLRQLARHPDSLIARRHGVETAAAVSTRAAELVAAESHPDWPAALAAFDASLRRPRRLNPGTTADLVAAALYILLWQGRLQAALPPAPLPRPSSPAFQPPPPP